MKRSAFTLVELAIVLVIIGIILGAVLKGRDLIEEARIKKFTNEVKQWEIYQWSFYDRMGRYAGDQGVDGIIGDQTGEDAKVDLTENAHFINAPSSNEVRIGSKVFYVYYGYVKDSDGKDQNAIIICTSPNCDSTFDNDTIPYFTSLDTSIDGVADGTTGEARCTSSDASVTSTAWIANFTPAPTWTSCNSTAKAFVFFIR